MSWKERMKVRVSRAEEEVYMALHERGVHPMRDHVITLDATVPDLYFHEQRLCVYLDGEEVHSKEHQRLRDEHVDDCLRRQGFKVLRIRYDPALSKRRLRGILDEIEEALKS